MILRLLHVNKIHLFLFKLLQIDSCAAIGCSSEWSVIKEAISDIELTSHTSRVLSARTIILNYQICVIKNVHRIENMVGALVFTMPSFANKTQISLIWWEKNFRYLLLFSVCSLKGGCCMEENPYLQLYLKRLRWPVRSYAIELWHSVRQRAPMSSNHALLKLKSTSSKRKVRNALSIWWRDLILVRIQMAAEKPLLLLKTLVFVFWSLLCWKSIMTCDLVGVMRNAYGYYKMWSDKPALILSS